MGNKTNGEKKEEKKNKKKREEKKDSTKWKGEVIENIPV